MPRHTRRGEYGLFRYAPEATLPTIPIPSHLEVDYFYSASLACFYSALDTWNAMATVTASIKLRDETCAR